MFVPQAEPAIPMPRSNISHSLAGTLATTVSSAATIVTRVAPMPLKKLISAQAIEPSAAPNMRGCQ